MSFHVAPLLLLATLGASCVAARQPPAQLQNPFRPITLGELRGNAERYNGEMVSFSAKVDRVEETTGGVWLHLGEGNEKVILYVPVSFGGALREELASEVMQFEVRVGEKKLTSLGSMAIEVFPFQISKTTMFDEAIPISPPPLETPSR